MREIKFRIKDTKYKNTWVYFDMSKSEGNPLFDKELPLDPETVGQYTGLTDKNGKEVYEGDIVTSNTYPFVDGEGNQNYHGVVIWLEGGFVVKTVHSAETTVRGLSEGNVEHITDFLSHSPARLPEVIGNIYDNPELLKK